MNENVEEKNHLTDENTMFLLKIMVFLFTTNMKIDTRAMRDLNGAENNGYQVQMVAADGTYKLTQKFNYDRINCFNCI